MGPGSVNLNWLDRLEVCLCFQEESSFGADVCVGWLVRFLSSPVFDGGMETLVPGTLSVQRPEAVLTGWLLKSLWVFKTLVCFLECGFYL